MTIEVIHGDMLEELPKLAADSISAVVTDPPAGISFMGREWDSNKGGRDKWIAWMTQVAAECLRVVKPGGHALVWALPRTSHWTATAWENAGWQVRDRVAFLFGSGFPKSLDVSKAIESQILTGGSRFSARDPRLTTENDALSAPGQQWQDAAQRTMADDTPAWSGGRVKVTTPEAAQWQGWHTALKPAMEDWWLLRRPLAEKTVAANVLKYGTGAINVDACRVPLNGDYKCGANGRPSQTGLGDNYDPSRANQHSDVGRWPANLCHDGSDEVEAAFAAFADSDDQNPSRFFTNCSDRELLSSSANDIIEECNQRFASIANGRLCLNEADSVSVLTHAVQRASQGAATLRSCQGLGEIVTAKSMTHIFSGVITTILSIGEKHLQGLKLEQHFPSDGPVIVAVHQTQTGIITITISHWKSNGCADPVICDIMPTKTLNGALSEGSSRFHYSGKADGADRADSKHPTVKPVALMRWLVRLITPPGGTVLDCFAGSGSTGEAAMLEGFDAILIEQDAAHMADIRHRMKRWSGADLPLFADG